MEVGAPAARSVAAWQTAFYKEETKREDIHASRQISCLEKWKRRSAQYMETAGRIQSSFWCTLFYMNICKNQYKKWTANVMQICNWLCFTLKHLEIVLYFIINYLPKPHLLLWRATKPSESAQIGIFPTSSVKCTHSFFSLSRTHAVKYSVLYILYFTDHNGLLLVFLDHNKPTDTNTTAVPAVMLTHLMKTNWQLPSRAHFTGLFRFIRLHNHKMCACLLWS